MSPVVILVYHHCNNRQLIYVVHHKWGKHIVTLSNFINNTAEFCVLPLPGLPNSALKSAMCPLPAELSSPIDWGGFSKAGFSVDASGERDCETV